MASLDPHALYSHLVDDLREQIPPSDFNRMVEGKGEHWPGISHASASACSIYSSFLKKLEVGMTKSTTDKALAKFLLVNDNCKNWKMQSENLLDDILLGEFRKEVAEFWRPQGNGFEPLVRHHYDLLSKGAVGPGAGLGSPGGDFYTKLFSSSLTVTKSSLYFWYRRYCCSIPEWKNAEETRRLTFGDATTVEGNRLSFVSKNDDISRSICTEPVLNMYYQLGFSKLLEARLADHFGLNLATQQFKNRELAKMGSLFESFSTIDLSSASDSISMSMLRWALPMDFFRWLTELRSTHSKLPDGRLQELHMISTMGNGYTFPLQTMLFACIVKSAFTVDGLAPIYPRGCSEGNFGVNGDDIVVPTRLTSKVLRLLHLLGFLPNEDKTFVEGPFRESCGGDFFKGRNIRGVYVKTLASPHNRYALINQLNLFSTRTGLLMKRTVQALTKTVRFLPVPLHEKDDAGIRLTEKVAKPTRWSPENQAWIYHAWEPQPPPRLTIFDNVIRHPASYKPRIFNLSGLFIALLEGSINSNSISLKPKTVRYTRKPRVSSCWDSWSVLTLLEDLRGDIPKTILGFAPRFDTSRFETVAFLNLWG